MSPHPSTSIEPEQAYGSSRESETFFSEAFWLSADCVSLVRASDATLLRANGALCRMWNTTQQEVIGKTCADYSRWLKEDERLGFLSALQANGECLDYEGTMRMRDGRHVVFKLSSRTITLNGEPCILNTRRDITQERRIELALKLSELKYRRLFETAKDGILILDAQSGMVTDVNPFLIELMGFTYEEFLGKAIWELGFFKDVVANEAKFAELRSKEYVRYGGLPLKTRDGRAIEVEFVSNVYLVDGAKVIQCNIRDVTERRKAEEDVRRLNATLEQRVLERTSQLEAANRELEAFSYSVSHDLRAPLRAVDGYSQAVLEDYGPQLAGDGERFLQTIRASARQMGTLIDDLLRFSRLGREAMKNVAFSTTSLVRSAVEGLRALEIDREIDVQIDDLPPSRGDPALLRQVWVNLLSNAVKYTRGSKPAKIEIGSQQEDGGTVFFVRDNGAGFDMRYADKLFGVFQRLHRAEDYEGTGVGLAICQRIIHRHGGRIWAESKVNSGSTFFFTLGAETPQ